MLSAEVLEFRWVSVLCLGSCVLFNGSFVLLVFDVALSIIILMFSVMLCTALTVMYTVDSLFLRMFLFLCPTPCIYSCPHTDYIEQQAPHKWWGQSHRRLRFSHRPKSRELFPHREAYAYGFRKAFIEIWPAIGQLLAMLWIRIWIRWDPWIHIRIRIRNPDPGGQKWLKVSPVAWTWVNYTDPGGQKWLKVSPVAWT